MNISKRMTAMLAGAALAALAAGAANAQPAMIDNGPPITTTLADGSLVQVVVSRQDRVFKNTAVAFATAHCTPGWVADKTDPAKKVWGWAECKLGPTSYVVTEGSAQGITKELVHGLLFWGALENQKVMSPGVQQFNVSAATGNTSAAGGSATGGSSTSSSNSQGGNATGGNSSATSAAQGGSSSATGGNSNSSAGGGNASAGVGVNVDASNTNQGNGSSTANAGSNSSAGANANSVSGTPND